MRKKSILPIIIFILSFLLIGCASTENKTTKSDGMTTVYTTVYPLQYFVERIGGEEINVKSIYPPGADEHTFEPSQRDMMNIADSDMFFYIGLGLEGFVEKAKSTLKGENVEFVAIGETLHLSDETEEQHSEEQHEEADHEDTDGHDHGDVDPHVWLDPVYAKDLARATKDALVEKYPNQKETFETNFESLAKELDQLHLDFQETVKTSKHKEMIVSHAAFGYWEHRYGIEQISILGQSSSTEPSQKDIEKIVVLAKEKNLQYILFEQNVSTKLGEIIQKEIGAKRLTLHNLSTLTETDINNNETYITLMNKNIQSLQKALNE